LADLKTSDLTAKTSLATGDLLNVSEDAGGGSYTSKQMTASNISIGIGDFLQSLGKIITNSSSSYTAGTNDEIAILADASSNAITINLPAVATNVNRAFLIKKIDSSANVVTIDGSVSEVIDGETTQLLTAQWTAITIISNGSAWYIF